MTMLLAELAFSFYIYMPIVSDLRNPPMNWGIRAHGKASSTHHARTV
jgi:hypothetical protein